MTDHRPFRLIAHQSEMVVFGTRRQHIPSISAAQCRCRELIPPPSLLARQGVHFHFITPQCSEPASVLLTGYTARAALPMPQLAAPRFAEPGAGAGEMGAEPQVPRAAFARLISIILMDKMDKGAQGRREEEINHTQYSCVSPSCLLGVKIVGEMSSTKS